MESGELWKLRKQVLEVLGSKLNTDKCLLLLYGSTALGEDTELSDLDLALDCLEPIEDELFLQLEEELSLYVDTPKRIELVELRILSEEFLESIVPHPIEKYSTGRGFAGKGTISSPVNRRRTFLAPTMSASSSCPHRRHLKRSPLRFNLS